MKSVKKLFVQVLFVFLLLQSSTIISQQSIVCASGSYELTADKKVTITSVQEVLTSVEVLRCENDVLFAELGSGGFKLLINDSWIDIKQLITIGALSYYLKTDGTVYNALNNSKLGSFENVDYLVSNDKQLVAVVGTNFFKLNGANWKAFRPTYVPEKLTMTDEGLWFFIQSRTGYENTDLENKEVRRNGLTLDENGFPIVQTIPLQGEYNKFLWKVENISSETYELINKNGSKLIVNGQSEFDISLFDKEVYGTTAFRIKNGNSSLSYINNTTNLTTTDNNVEQVWLFHFNQMVSGYMLPRNEIIEDSGKAEYFDRALTGLYNTTFLGTKTTSDWALVNTYFIQTNIINAVKNQDWIKGDFDNNPNAGKGITNLFTYVINKNDTQFTVGNSYFNSGIGLVDYRGGANSGNNFMFTSEEFMCRTGVTHSPSDNYYREFDHPVHEFFHILERKLGLLSETEAFKDPFIVDARNTVTNPFLNFRDNSANSKSEGLAIFGQYYFNASFGEYNYPGNRLAKDWDENILLPFIHKYFNQNNIWLPPSKLRDEFEGEIGNDDFVEIKADTFKFSQITTSATEGVAVSGSNIYLGTETGLLISSDGGSTFTTKTTLNGLGSDSINDVFLDGATVYVATAGGISVSKNGGSSFVNYAPGTFSLANHMLDVYANGDDIYATSFYRVFISNDAGATFTEKYTSDGLGSEIYRGIIVDESDVYVVGDEGLSISTNGGDSFINKTKSDGLANVGANGVSISNGILYTVSEGFNPVGGLSISTDKGSSFSIVQESDGLAANSVNCVYSKGSNVFVGTSGSSISVSNDRGANFTVYKYDDGIIGVVNDIYFDSNKIYVSTNNGLVVGEEVSPEIDVLGNNVSILNGDITPNISNNTAFGDASATVTKIFTIDNSLGAADLQLIGTSPNYVTISGSSDFAISIQPSSGSVKMGESTTFEVVYIPTISGTQSATISITNNDLDENPYTFTISGNAINGINTLIPDINFEQALIDQSIDSDGVINGQVLTEDIEIITELVISDLGILDLTGIQDFKALIKLDVGENKLESLNLSSNTNLESVLAVNNQLTNLNVLNCTNLRELYCQFNSILNLDVSSNTLLETISCGVNSLSSLDVSKNTELTILTIDNNNLTSLDISNNTKLEILGCSVNSISSLDVTKHPLLKNINTSKTDLSSLDISHNLELEILSCQFNQLTNLDVTNNVLLKKIRVNNNSLAGIDITQNIGLTEFDAKFNSIINIDINQNTKLTTLALNDNKLERAYLRNGANSLIATFNIKNNPGLTCIAVDDVTFSNTNWIDKDATANYNTDCNSVWTIYTEDTELDTALAATTGLDTDNDGKITYEEAQAFTGTLDLSGKNIFDVKGLEAFTNAQVIDISGNIITDISSLLKANSVLVQSKTTGEKRSYQRRTNNVKKLLVADNLIKEIDISKISNITELDAKNNKLTALNLKNGTNVTLIKVDATGNPNLTCIEVDNVDDANTKTQWIKDETATYSTSCKALSIDSNFLKENIAVYPNPAKSFIEISLSNSLELKSVEVYNLIGKKILSTKKPTVVVENLSNGVYLMKIITNKGSINKRIVKE